ncbi:YqaJ viral recombinase family protein [Paraburkholderia hospita]|nr:YqaJ viral recombinase family protein [Paraburkholderia hospita]
MNREEFLLARSSGVGGSDSAAALGLSPYKTTYELWLEKTKQLAAEDLDDVERIQFGRLMEDIIAREYARRTDVKVRRRNQVIRHAKYPWMLANVDRVIEGVRRGLECKNVDSMAYRMGEWGEPGSDQVPEHYLMQCHHYMIVLDYPEWDLAACVGGNSLVTYTIRRDAELEEMILEGEHEFWQRVEKHEAPEPDYTHPTTLALLKRMYTGTDGGEIEFGEDLAHWHRVKQMADERVKEYEAVSDGAKAHMLRAMGNAAIARLPDGSTYKRKEVTRKAYEVAQMTYVDFRWAKAKE